VSECFFWYRLTLVIPDKGPLNVLLLLKLPSLLIPIYLPPFGSHFLIYQTHFVSAGKNSIWYA